jgi:hypothetical protein
MRLARSCLCLLFVLALPVARAGAQTLQLADGQMLVGEVVDGSVSGDGLRVLRFDNGGALDLRWEDLAPECATRLKRAYDLGGDEQGEIMVTAHEVRYLLNGSPQTVVGRVVDDPATDVLVVQQKGHPWRIPRAEIKQVRQVEVPVSQVFTQDEFYAQRLVDVAPGDVADKHVQLAEDLVRMRDYAHALDHLNRARELGNSRAPERIEKLTERVKLYVAAKKERDVLDAIQVSRSRGTLRDFERGAQWIAQFEKDFPQSRLKGEFETEKKRFAEARTRFFSQQVAEAWRRSISIVADKKVQEPGLTLAAVREYAESKMGDDVAATVAARLELDVEECKQLFSARDKYPAGKRTEHFSYGIGSWVLGETEILEGTKQGEQAKKGDQDPADAKELERITRAIRKMMEQRAAAQGQGGQGREQTDEEWWTDTDRSERANWLRAYYAENSGQLVLTGAYTQPCFACQALGTQSELGPGNKVIKVKCYLCHGTKWLRTFKAY